MPRNAKRIVRNNEYDPFARIYNRFWGADYRGEVAPVVDRLLLSKCAPGSSILDICCGTGQFTDRVRQRGFKVQGVDASSAMLRFARANARGIRFTLADVRDFELERKFDAGYSIYESLNHVPDVSGLMMAFRSVRRHLRRGAPFLFDLNREEAYDLYWNQTDAVAESDIAYITRSHFDEISKVGTCDITTFELINDDWKRTDFTVRQTCHAIEKAVGALQKAGFQDIALYDARDLGMTADAGYGRTFFVASA